MAASYNDWRGDVMWQFHERVHTCDEEQHWSRVLDRNRFSPDCLSPLTTADTWQRPRTAVGRRYASVQHGLACEQLLYSLYASKPGFRRWHDRLPVSAAKVWCTDIFSAVWQLYELEHARDLQDPWSAPSLLPMPHAKAEPFSGPHLWFNLTVLAHEIDAKDVHRFLLSDGQCMVWVWDDLLHSREFAINGNDSYGVGGVVAVSVQAWQELREDGRDSVVLRGNVLKTKGCLELHRLFESDGQLHESARCEDGTLPYIDAIAPMRCSGGSRIATLVSARGKVRLFHSIAPIHTEPEPKKDDCLLLRCECILPPPEQWQLIPSTWMDLTRGSCRLLQRHDNFRGLVKLQRKPQMLRGRRGIFVLTVHDGETEEGVVIDMDTVDAWLHTEMITIADPDVVLQYLHSRPSPNKGGVNGDTDALWHALSELFDEGLGHPLLLDITSCRPPDAYDLASQAGVARSCWVRNVCLATNTVYVGSFDSGKQACMLDCENLPALRPGRPGQAKLARLLFLALLSRMNKERATLHSTDLFVAEKEDIDIEVVVKPPVALAADDTPPEVIWSIARFLNSPHLFMAFALTSKRIMGALREGGGLDMQCVQQYLAWHSHKQCRDTLAMTIAWNSRHISALQPRQFEAYTDLCLVSSMALQEAILRGKLWEGHDDDFDFGRSIHEQLEHLVFRVFPEELADDAAEGDPRAAMSRVELAAGMSDDDDVDPEPMAPVDQDVEPAEIVTGLAEDGEAGGGAPGTVHEFGGLADVDTEDDEELVTEDDDDWTTTDYEFLVDSSAVDAAQANRLIFGVPDWFEVRASAGQSAAVFETMQQIVLNHHLRRQTMGESNADPEQGWSLLSRILRRAAPLSIFCNRALANDSHRIAHERLVNAFAWAGPLHKHAKVWVGPTGDTVYDALKQAFVDNNLSLVQKLGSLSLWHSALDAPIRSAAAFQAACLVDTYNKVDKWRIVGVVQSVIVGQGVFVRGLNHSTRETTHDRQVPVNDYQWRLAVIPNDMITLFIYDGDMTIPVCISSDLYQKLLLQIEKERQRYAEMWSASSEMTGQMHYRSEGGASSEIPSVVAFESGIDNMKDLLNIIVELDVYMPTPLIHLFSSELLPSIRTAMQRARPAPHRLVLDRSVVMTMRFESEHVAVVHSGFRNTNVYRTPDNLVSRAVENETMVLAQQASTGACHTSNPGVPFLSM